MPITMVGSSTLMRARLARALVLVSVLLCVAAAPARTWAQAKVPRVGVLSQREHGSLPAFQMFERVLAERGWTAGKNVILEYRSPDTEQLEFRKPAEELVRLKVDVIYAASAPALRAAFAATRTIPIVALDFTNDPVAAGFAQSYNRPGRNVTGLFLDAPEFTSKWLEILKALKPGLSRVAVLWDPSPGTTHLRGLERAAKTLTIELEVIEIHKPDDIDRAISGLGGARAEALIQLPSPLMYAQSARVGALVRQRGLLGISIWRRFTEGGGAVSYGPDFVESTQRSALILAKILSGAKAGDLPIERPTKFEFIINQNSIKGLGLSAPESLLLRADEVIR
jgi:putative tryptophan/tyrosine transport system substrate-binding protein